MASTPSFAATPNTGASVSNVLSASVDSSYTAPTYGKTIFTAGTNGSILNRVDFMGTGTTAAGVVQLYLYDGTNYHAWVTQLVPLVTPSTSTAPFYATQSYNNVILRSGWSVVATSFVASQNINVQAFGEDL